MLHASLAAMITPRRELTDEDRSIWLKVCCRRAPLGSPCAAHAAELSDVKDYIAMLQFQMIARFGPAGIQFEGIDVRGWDQQ